MIVTTKSVFLGVLFLGIGFLWFTGFSSASEYYTIEAYESLHPDQAEKAKVFSQRIKGPGKVLAKGLQKKPVVISVIYPGQQVSDYWRRSITAFKARMDEIHLEYEIKEFFTKPVVDYRFQEQLIRKSLDMKPDYLVFTLDIQKHKRLIQRIITRKSPKVILQNITTPLRAWEGKQPFLYVGFDHIKGTEKLARYYLDKTRGRGYYALLYFSRGYVSVMRGESFMDLLAPYPELVQHSAYYTDGNRLKAREAVLEILGQTRDLDFIYACSTDVALGAIDALAQVPGTDPILINGWGGGSSELKAIMDGDMDVTVMRINDDNGVAMAEAIALDIQGKALEVPQIFSGEFALVEKGIEKERLDRLQKQAFRYSGAGE